MPPSQDKNAGNQGDVWKHKLLLDFVRILVRDSSRGREFRYAETHAGKGIYRLHRSRDSQKGIGHALQVVPAQDRDFYLTTEAPAFELGRYIGSWPLVAALLSSRDINYRFDLVDKSRQVIRVGRVVAADAPTVHFHPADGFKTAGQFDADLLFADPFTAWPRTIRMAQRLEQCHFLIWYPIFRSTEPDQLVRATDLIGCEALWRPFHVNVSPTLRGCGLLVSSNLHYALQELSSSFLAFANTLGWRFHLRTP